MIFIINLNIETSQKRTDEICPKCGSLDFPRGTGDVFRHCNSCGHETKLGFVKGDFPMPQDVGYGID